MAEQWRPVADGEYESQHVTDSCIVEGEWLTVQERVIGSDDTEVATIALPENLRLCERVEDALISPEALREAGWTEDARGRLVLSIDLEYSLKRFSYGTVWIHFGKAAAPLLGCRSMAQLSALVAMLTPAD